ncbi:hypothetical protein BGX28_008879 [Mortierella sp. GBA30]|nr:hypothetical protein BGX28_008879 [Mortierella sp. GBA30]
MLQETIQKLLHPPPLATLLLVVSVIWLLPQKYRQRILGLVDHVLTLDLMMAIEEMPSLSQTWSLILYYKPRLLNPLARILLGWESDDGFDIDNTGLGTSRIQNPSQSQLTSTTGANLPDRSKIISRAQLHQLHNTERETATSGMLSAVNSSNASTTTASFRHVHGLVNTGNSCFLNSVLQALSALSSLPSYLESLLDRSDELQVEEDKVELTEALLDTIEALQQPLPSHKSFRPRAIVSALESSRAKSSKGSGSYSSLMNREQQDAQELFQIISSALSTEEATLQKLQATRPLLNLDFLKTLLGLGPNKHGHQIRKMGSNPMMGMLASRLSCMQCGYTEAVRHFTFDNLSLSLPSTHACNLEDCLQQYVSLESLHDVVCRKCSLLATLTRIGNELSRLDGQPPLTHGRLARSRRCQLEDAADSGASDGSLDSLSESEEGSPWDDDADEADDDHRGNFNNRLEIETKAEKAVVTSKLVQQHKIVQSAIQSDIERPLPDIKLAKIVSRHCTKQVMLAKLPSVLCLHFVRSQYSHYGTVSKNSCQVRFPEYLDLSPFSTTGVLLTQPNLPMSICEQDLERMGNDRSRASSKHKQAPQQRKLYRLQSIVVHYGGHSYGHFIAYRRKPESMRSKVSTVDVGLGLGLGLDDTMRSRAGSLYSSSQAEDWFRVSDETVESVRLDQVLNSNPYMCLYEKVETSEEKDRSKHERPLSSFSLQATELGFRKLLLKKLRLQGAAGEQDRNRKESVSPSPDSGRVDLAAISEKEYAELFRERPKAAAGLSRMTVQHRQLPSFHLGSDDEDMSDMESLQSQDEDRTWRSFVSSPNSTTPPSPNTSSADSSASSSSLASPIMKQRTNTKTQSHDVLPLSPSPSASPSLNSLGIQLSEAHVDLFNTSPSLLPSSHLLSNNIPDLYSTDIHPSSPCKTSSVASSSATVSTAISTSSSVSVVKSKPGNRKKKKKRT